MLRGQVAKIPPQQNSPELLTQLSDVNIGSDDGALPLADGDVLSWVAADHAWENQPNRTGNFGAEILIESNSNATPFGAGGIYDQRIVFDTIYTNDPVDSTNMNVALDTALLAAIGLFPAMGASDVGPGDPFDRLRCSSSGFWLISWVVSVQASATEYVFLQMGEDYMTPASPAFIPGVFSGGAGHFQDQEIGQSGVLGLRAGIDPMSFFLSRDDNTNAYDGCLYAAARIIRLA